MKKIIAVFFSVMLFLTPMVYAESFDTNKVDGSTSKYEGNGSSSTSKEDSLYRYWYYKKQTGTRYIIRIYDWNTEKYIAVPKEYYVNHILSGKKEVLYLGVDKTASGKYTPVRTGSSVFSDKTYEHILQWFDNDKVSDFGLSKNDINLLATVIQEQANKDGNIAVAKDMQNIIDGTAVFDIRAEILFLLKMPGSQGTKRVATVVGNGSVENYNFVFYDNASKDSSNWRMEYLTYLEAKAVSYRFGDDCGMRLKSYWLDKIACALYEKDEEYVFVNGVYQCSCDLYRRMFGSNVSYTLVDNKINLNQPSSDPNDSSDRWYMYLTPGRCGIPVKVNNTTYYVTPGKTYSNIEGQKVTIAKKIKYLGNKTGIQAHEYGYLNVVTDDATRATIYEGWDYITNNLASTLVIAIDKDTGNIINQNGITYSQFENVTAGTYTKNAWDISGYKYVGNLTQDYISLPKLPIQIKNTDTKVDVNITEKDVSNGAKKQVIFVYEKSSENADNEVKLSVYNIKNLLNNLMFTGSYEIDKDNNLVIKFYDKGGNEKYSEKLQYVAEKGYVINTQKVEEMLKIDSNSYKYVGSLIKTHSEYFLTYMGENLEKVDGNIFDLKNINNQKVHIILGYEQLDKTTEVEEQIPEIKVSYVDENGKTIKDSVITKENLNEGIIKTREDLKQELYMYIGYTYEDTQNDFASIVTPIKVKGTSENVTTTFTDGNQRRHIIFVYKKIDLKFNVDIIMKPNDLDNQLIGQKENEDYWVLDSSGKVTMKITVTGDEGLNISYAVKLKIPFDTVINGHYIPANSINNLTVTDLSNIIVANDLKVPVWVTEKEYDLIASIDANIEGFGSVTVSKKDNVEVVGRLYDFTITNLDGSKITGDNMWKDSLFKTEDIEYKANSIPIGQRDNQPQNYNYGIKLGTNFFYSINTKGLKNSAISITPKFLYVGKNSSTAKEVDVLIKQDGKWVNIKNENISVNTLKLNEQNVLKNNVKNEIIKAQEISKFVERYNYSTSKSRSLGSLANPIISKYLSLPYVNYINEFKELYGTTSMNLANKTESELLECASHWYGKYVIPDSAKVVDLDDNTIVNTYEDGYLIVMFKIISLDNSNGEYLSYDLPTANTQWQKENLNQLLKLPNLSQSTNNDIIVNTYKGGYAPVIIYQVGLTIKDNVTSAGTH